MSKKLTDKEKAIIIKFLGMAEHNNEAEYECGYRNKEADNYRDINQKAIDLIRQSLGIGRK